MKRFSVYFSLQNYFNLTYMYAYIQNVLYIREYINTYKYTYIQTCTIGQQFNVKIASQIVNWLALNNNILYNTMSKNFTVINRKWKTQYTLY